MENTVVLQRTRLAGFVILPLIYLKLEQGI
jgi:hypothetical protein